MNQPIAIEICVGDVESAIAAEAGGADRVELCDNLAVGGTTPSFGTIAETHRRLRIPIHVLIRPRAGDFCYSERELAVMERDLEAARAIGVAGIVLGVLTTRCAIDSARLARLVEAARPLSVTFHKAIDTTEDPLRNLDSLIELGVDRVLSSGGQASAIEGAAMLRSMVERAQGQIAIMAGGQVLTATASDLVRRTGVREIHVGSAVSRVAEHFQTADLPFPPWNRTDAALVRELVEAVGDRELPPRGIPLHFRD
ncbi:MAG: copper homeostasis protein CutC [Isosphaeraceae bacterium]